MNVQYFIPHNAKHKPTKGKGGIEGRCYKVKKKTQKKIRKLVISGNDNVFGQDVPLQPNSCPI